MKPVLYEANETAFSDMGLGQLNPISCIVVEERNGMYELEMVYSAEDPRASSIVEGRIILAKPNDTDRPQPFQIYKISKVINKSFTVNAEHISYRLSDIPVMAFSASSAGHALTAMQTAMAEPCGFTFATDVTRAGSVNFIVPTNARKVLMGEEGSIFDKFHGEFKFDRFNVVLRDARGADNGLKIIYRRNMTDLEQETSLEDVITGVCPFWQSGETVVTLPEKVLHASTFGRYPYAKTAVLDLSAYIDGEPTEAELRSQAQKYIKTNKIGYPKISITVKFAPLWQTDEYKNIAPLEHVSLCDWVTVYLEELGINEKVKVTRTEYNVLKERYGTVTLGTVKYGFTEAILSSIIGTRRRDDEDTIDRDDPEPDWYEPVDDYDDGWDPTNNIDNDFDGTIYDDDGNGYILKIDENGDVKPIMVPERIIFTKMPQVDYTYDELIDNTPAQIKAVYSSTNMVEITEDCVFNPEQDTAVSTLIDSTTGQFPMEATWLHEESGRMYKCTTTGNVTRALITGEYMRFSDVRISLEGYRELLMQRGTQAAADLAVFDAAVAAAGGINSAAFYYAKYGRAPLSAYHFITLKVSDSIPYYVYQRVRQSGEPEYIMWEDEKGVMNHVYNNDILFLNKSKIILSGYTTISMDHGAGGDCTITHSNYACKFSPSDLYSGMYAPLSNVRFGS